MTLGELLILGVFNSAYLFFLFCFLIGDYCLTSGLMRCQKDEVNICVSFRVTFVGNFGVVGVAFWGIVGSFVKLGN